MDMVKIVYKVLDFFKSFRCQFPIVGKWWKPDFLLYSSYASTRDSQDTLLRFAVFQDNGFYPYGAIFLYS